MATTLTTSTLKVWIKEDVKINGEQHGAETKFNVSVKHVSKTIASTNALAETTLLTFNTVPGQMQFVEGDVRYIRITNLDDTNFVTLNIEGDAATDMSIRLDPLTSYIAMFDPLKGAVDYGDISGTTLEDLTAIKATADTAACDLEVFVASA